MPLIEASSSNYTYEQVETTALKLQEAFGFTTKYALEVAKVALSMLPPPIRKLPEESPNGFHEAVTLRALPAPLVLTEEERKAVIHLLRGQDFGWPIVRLDDLRDKILHHATIETARKELAVTTATTLHSEQWD